MSVIEQARSSGPEAKVGDGHDLASRAARSAWARTGTIRRRRRSTASRSTASGSTARRSPTAQFREFVEATGYVTFAEIAPDPKDYPGALPHMLKAGSLVFTPPEAAGRPARLEPVVDVQVRRQLAPALRPGQLDQRARRSSGRARRLSRRRGLRQVGRQGAADRGRVGVRRARRARRRRVRLGRRVHAGRPAHGQHLAGRVSRTRTCEPTATSAPRRSTRVPAERLRPPRHDRQRLGVDDRLVFDQARGRRAEGLLHPGEPARRAARTRATTRASPTSGSRARC